MSNDPEHTDTPKGSLRSPIRPSSPTGAVIPSYGMPHLPAPEPPDPPPPDPAPQDSLHALVLLRRKVEALVEEYAQGALNRVQFNALYQRYSDQRAIIEKLVQRNPDSEAWRQVVSSRGQTGFLRARLEAQPISYRVYAADRHSPLLSGGECTTDAEFPAEAVLRAVWAMPNRPAIGLGRKPLDDDRWLVMAVGSAAATLVIFSLEPSKTQAQLLRDLHIDFEHANQMALARGWLVAERLVFPQRALFEQEF
ncbi:MAG TPA: hypothetical protein VER79_14420 [Candidatus Limnocylindrales bacterium]|nr:hypothetical protein [Candidatus Limnocylindrales bacterium]